MSPLLCSSTAMADHSAFEKLEVTKTGKLYPCYQVLEPEPTNDRPSCEINRYLYDAYQDISELQLTDM